MSVKDTTAYKNFLCQPRDINVHHSKHGAGHCEHGTPLLMMHDLSEAGLNRRPWVTTAVGKKKITDVFARRDCTSLIFAGPIFQPWLWVISDIFQNI